MSENTRGWWLSQLEEPLRTMAEETDIELVIPCYNLGSLGYEICLHMNGDSFWCGAWHAWSVYIGGQGQVIQMRPNYRDSNNKQFLEGWEMARNCAPIDWLKQFNL